MLSEFFFILLLSSLKNSQSAFLIISGHFVHWTYVKMSQNAQTQHSPSGSTPIKVVKKVETAKKYIPSEKYVFNKVNKLHIDYSE